MQKAESIQNNELGQNDTCHTTKYVGELELVVKAPMNLSLASKLYIALQTIPELRIISSRGSLRKGATIAVSLGKPTPICEILEAKLPEMEISQNSSAGEDAEQDDYGPLLIAKNEVLNRLFFSSRQAAGISAS